MLQDLLTLGVFSNGGLHRVVCTSLVNTPGHGLHGHSNIQVMLLLWCCGDVSGGMELKIMDCSNCQEHTQVVTEYVDKGMTYVNLQHMEGGETGELVISQKDSRCGTGGHRQIRSAVFEMVELVDF
ncbi:hypothetical protein Tco_0922663 [Tanacetum coccineum]|uniref:Uncharacterized protein n=1 Tax=Tanacetum coccineum TaxID=301880 RepID=A0ABQ5D5Z4_9ASTR